MENYVLYEELSQSNGCTIYKGRRKGSTEYVAIHCIEKYLRPQITNTVRLTHDVAHKNIVQFHEWYETSNHLWLVAELCVGGSLQEIMNQDGALLEKAIFNLGLDLARGLHQLHSLGILFCDFSPSKILVDSPGTLKYGDFSLARLEGEDLSVIYAETQTTDDPFDEKIKCIPEANLKYAAPEIKQKGIHSVKSDLWSLGRLLYEMFTGQHSIDKIDSNNPSNSLFRNISQKPSEEFRDLVLGLMINDPSKRFGWDEVMSHPFWQSELEESESNFEQTSITGASLSGSIISDRMPGHEEAIATPLISPQREFSNSINGETQFSKHKGSAGKGSTEPAVFTLSSRPFTSAFENKVSMTATSMTRVVSPVWVAFQTSAMRDDPFWASVASLLYHPSDLVLSSIADNPRVQRLYPLIWEVKSLQVPALTVSECLEITTGEFQDHWKRLLDIVGMNSARCTPQKKIHVLNYMASLASSQPLVTRITGYDSLKQLILQLKPISQLDIAVRAARVIALIASNMTYLDKEANFTETVLTVTEVLRAHYRDMRLRHSLLIALGELVVLGARMEHEYQCMLNNWSIPSVTVTIINRCLQESDDNITNHYASKIVENVSSLPGRMAQMLAQNDISQSLWYLFAHTPIEGIRITAISALCRMTLHSVHIFHAVLEKAGLLGTMDALKSSSVRIQQAILTIVGALLAAGIHAQKFAQDRDLLQRILRLLESPCTVLRAKVFLIISEIVKHNQDSLIICCQSRLVMYIERDSRRQTVVDSAARMQWDYMYRCIDLLISSLSNLTPVILGDVINILKAVHGRKHPNSSQAKLLRANLPLLPVILHFITSQVFRPQILNEPFFISMGNLLEILKTLEKGETAIDFVCGANAQDNLTSTALSILEAITQHPACMDQYSVAVTSKILSPLASLIVLNSYDTRLFCLKIFTDIVTLYLSKADINDDNVDKKIISTIHEIISDTLLPHMDEFLQDSDPLPSYTLRLLQAVLEQSCSFVQDVEKLGLASLLFQLLKDHNDNPLSSTVQSIVGIVTCILSDKSINIDELYKLGLIHHLSNLMTNTSSLCVNGNPPRMGQDTSFLLLLLLDGLLSILNRVASIVRKTLQAQKQGEDADPALAEQHLLINKPLTEIAGTLAQLLCHPDTDIQDLSCRLLSLLVQLYGAECHFALLPGHVDCFGIALNQATSKKQKVLIKTLLRLVTADPDLSCPLRDHGKYLIRKLEEIAGKEGALTDNGTVPSLATELLNMISCS